MIVRSSNACWTISATVLVSLAAACSSPTTDGAHAHADVDDSGHHAGMDVGEHGHDADASHEPPDLAAIDFGEVVITPAAEEYCERMLVGCHDPFHETYGEDDAEAIGSCQREASAWPVAGSVQTSGNSIECRQYHCENAGDATTCEDALGPGCI